MALAQKKEAPVKEALIEEIGVVPEFRVFTYVNGNKVEALLLSRDNENKTFEILPKGRVHPVTIPFDQISPKDLDFIKHWISPKDIFLNKCQGFTIPQLLEFRGYESIPFKLVGNAIMITGKLNGKDARIKVDAGTAATLLHIPFAKAANCKIGPMNQKIWGIAGFQPAGRVQVAKLEIGSSVFLDEFIQGADRNFNMPKGFRLREEILLGADFLTKLEAIISYKDRAIFLRPDKGNAVAINQVKQVDNDFTRHCGDLTVNEILDLRGFQSSDYHRMGNHMFANGTLNDQEVLWKLDTQADISLLDLEWAEKTGCEIGPLNKKVFRVGGWAPAATALVKKITLGDVMLTNKVLLSTDMRQRNGIKPNFAGIIGADYLKDLDAIIAVHEGRFFLKKKK